ncbi:Amidinohydrolase [Nitrosotalea sinensis]|uniref:Amidinohydrolase n=1 Tax=Nitrosotalea sinensis TaxID=1499975 RepID=A0A2H1EIN8_9ARCH|nr:agmatinase [Candidatus Nitrosotalea sinensis]SHO47272.1 Amidinohydrolase [Candidatus Nitrosotalea sinensis]
MNICWANTDSFNEADIVVVGIPDESKSHALRKGTSEAPHKIREISTIRDTYRRGNDISIGLPLDGITKKIYDHGNIERNQVSETITKIVAEKKIPIAIGGDHSISTEIIKAISRKYGPLSLVYFDAHPDFISSVRGYYGSVFYDVLDSIDIESSIQIGIRTPEKEEIDNIKKYNIEVVTPFDISRDGIHKTEQRIMNKLGKNVYISLDMDVIDPAFAPGVSVPVPLGLGNIEVTYLLKALAAKGMSGLDIMETCPNYDIKDRTSHLVSRIIGEVISSAR